MRFTDPIYLLLLIPIVGLLFWSSTRIIGMTRKRRRNSLILRFILLCLVTFALAGPELRKTESGTSVIFIVDRSDSIRDEQRVFQDQFIASAVTKLSSEDRVGRVVFGKEAQIDANPGFRQSFPKINAIVEPSQSDLAGAIRLATAALTDGKAKRLVILSDGNETNGSANLSAEVAAASGIQIDYVQPPKLTKSIDALITQVEAPSQGKKSQPFDLRVEVESRGVRSGRLVVSRDGQIIGEKRVALNEGINSILFSQKLDRTGLVRYQVKLEAGEDIDVRNNVGSAFINVTDQPKVLIVQGDEKDLTLTQALRASGIDVELVNPSSFPTRAESLQSYESILLNNVNAKFFTVRLQNALITANRDSGIGLAMIGGEDSFLPGGWYGTPVIDALPVDLNIRQKKSMAAASVFILADCSGSMGAMEDGQTKIKLASRAAEETIKMLGPMDRVGVAGSSDGIEIVTPMQSAANKEQAITGARKLAVTGGGIYIRPSIAKAYEVLKNEPSKTRHFILLADGGDSTDWAEAFETALKMQSEKITTSVVAIGDGKDVPNLKRLALLGGGRFYLAKRAAQLPAFFTQDTAVMSRSAIEEGAFTPKISVNDPSISGVFDAGAPQLLAYCLAESKPLSKVILKSEKNDPLYLTGRNGLGSTFAFTSDATGRWAKNWVPWSGFSTFWSQIVREVARKAAANQYSVRLSASGAKQKVTIDGKDLNGNPLTAPETPVRIGKPNGESEVLQLTQTAPGRYEGDFSAEQVGSYILSISEPDGKGGNRIQVTGVNVSYPAEYRTSFTNTPLLKQLAEVTNGKEIQNIADVFRPSSKVTPIFREIWPSLILLAMLLLPFEIAHRRIVVRWLDLLKRKKVEEAPQRQTISTLKAAKARAPKQRVTDLPSRAPTIMTPQAEMLPETPEKEPTTDERTNQVLLAKKRNRNKTDG